MAEKYTYKVEETKLKNIVYDLGLHYGLQLLNYGKPENGGKHYSFEFPFSKDEFYKIFEDSPLPPIAENLPIIDAIMYMTCPCRMKEYIEQKAQQSDDSEKEFDEYVERLKQEYEEEHGRPMDDQTYEALIDDLTYFDYDAYVECFYYERARKDLLMLYKAFQEWIEAGDEDTTITIKMGKCKSVKLENVNNWFSKVLLSNHFDEYLKPIKSKEDAIAELNSLSYKGAKLPRPLTNNFIWGTYNIISNHLNDGTVTKSFCYLLVELFKIMNYPKSYIDKLESDPDFKYLRSTISNIKRDPETHLRHVEVSSWGVKKAIEEGNPIALIGCKLYRKMK